MNKNELEMLLSITNMYLEKYSWKDLEILRDKIVEVFVND
jgi:hypothetical protein